LPATGLETTIGVDPDTSSITIDRTNTHISTGLIGDKVNSRSHGGMHIIHSGTQVPWVAVGGEGTDHLIGGTGVLDGEDISYFRVFDGDGERGREIRSAFCCIP